MSQVKSLKQLRREKKLTESQMAALVGLSRPGVSKIERGETTTTATLAVFARVLEIDPAQAFASWEAGKINRKLLTDNRQTA